MGIFKPWSFPPWDGKPSRPLSSKSVSHTKTASGEEAGPLHLSFTLEEYGREVMEIEIKSHTASIRVPTNNRAFPLLPLQMPILVAFMRDGMYSFLSSKITYCHSLIARNNATTGWEDNQRREEGRGGEASFGFRFPPSRASK